MKPERLEPLFRNKTMKIERITSRGHATPKGRWLRGSKNEWVMLMSGAARVRFEKGRTIAMKTGSTLLIPAGRAHRVEWTKPGVRTVWLAVHWPSD